MTLSQEFEQLREINRKGAEDVADIFLGNGFIGLATGVVCDAGHCSWISENGQVMRSQIDSIDAIRFFNFGDGYQRNLGWHLGVSAGLGMVAGGTVASNTQDFSTGEKVAMTLLTGALVAPIGLLTAAIQDPENSLSSAYTTFLFRDSPEVRRRILFYERPFGWQRLDRYTKPSR